MRIDTIGKNSYCISSKPNNNPYFGNIIKTREGMFALSRLRYYKSNLQTELTQFTEEFGNTRDYNMLVQRGYDKKPLFLLQSSKGGSPFLCHSPVISKNNPKALEFKMAVYSPAIANDDSGNPYNYIKDAGEIPMTLHFENQTDVQNLLDAYKEENMTKWSETNNLRQCAAWLRALEHQAEQT